MDCWKSNVPVDYGVALGDAMENDAVIVGGLVPVLLYQNVRPVWEYGEHAGTADVDSCA